MAKKKWIQSAIKRPGALTKKAKAAGESPMEFARGHKDSPGTTGKQARLALTLSKFEDGGNVDYAEGGKVRGVGAATRGYGKGMIC